MLFKSFTFLPVMQTETSAQYGFLSEKFMLGLGFFKKKLRNFVHN